MIYDLTDPYDVLCNLAQLDNVRITHRFQIFASAAPLGWRICEAEVDGTFRREIRDDLSLQECFSLRTLLNQAEALSYIQQQGDLLCKYQISPALRLDAPFRNAT